MSQWIICIRKILLYSKKSFYTKVSRNRCQNAQNCQTIEDWFARLLKLFWCTFELSKHFFWIEKEFCSKFKLKLLLSFRAVFHSVKIQHFWVYRRCHQGAGSFAYHYALLSMQFSSFLILSCIFMCATTKFPP